MKTIPIFFAFAIFVLGVFGFSPLPEKSAQTATQVNPWVAPKEVDILINPYLGNAEATAKGKILFEKKCWQCHGLDGKGTGPNAAKLNPKPANYTDPLIQMESDGALLWKITTGRGVMPGFKTALTMEERWQLVNYIREFGKAKE